MTRLGSFWRTNTVTIGIVIIVMAFGTILFLQASATSKLQKQTQQQTEILSKLQGVTAQLNKGAAQRTAQIQTLTAHIDCIVTFFSLPQAERTNSAIQDINTCTLKNSNTGTSTQTQSQSTSSSTAPAATTPTNNSTSSTSPAAPSQTSTTTPTTPEAAPSTPFLQRVVVNPIKSIINAL